MPANAESSTYFLSPHVFCCHTPRYSIFLDLNRDLYLSVPREQLASAIQIHDTPQLRLPRPAEAHNIVDQLARENILTTDPRAGKPIFPSTQAYHPIPSRSQPRPTRISILHIIAFLHAMISTSLSLRYRRLDKIISKLQSHRERLQNQCGDVSRISELLYVFARLRPFYPRHSVCLYDSIALLTFLAAFRIRSTLIIGVTADPFAAHCWIQHGDLALNETPEEASRYTPILLA